MGEVLDMMRASVVGTFTAFWEWLQTIDPNPLTWEPAVLLAVAALLSVLLLMLLLFRPRRQDDRPAERPRRPEPKPNLLVSLGEITVHELEEDGRTVRQFDLGLLFSNMNEYPVQLLELAVTTKSAPVLVEAAYFVPAASAIKVSERIGEIEGEDGTLDLYVYAPQTARQFYRLRATFAWEPWNERFKISPLEQRIAPSKRLASVDARPSREREWRERQERPPRPLDASDERRRIEFPDDF